MSKIASFTVLLSFWAQVCFADLKDPLGVLKESQGSAGFVSEYVFKNDIEEVLVPVYILGAVTKPGLYHVPARTDLLTLLSISGGPTKDAELGDVSIKRGQTNQVTEVNVDRVITEKDLRSPALGANDVVYVKTEQPAINGNTILAISLISGVLTIILSGVIIAKYTKPSNAGPGGPQFRFP